MAVTYMSVLASSGGTSGVPIDSFEITTPPSKLTYEVGDSLDTTGIVVTATADGMTGNVASRCTYNPTTFESLGAHAVTCNYHGEQDAFNILVTEGTIGTLEETSWSLIKSVGAAGVGSQYWSVGDAKTVAVDGTVGDQTVSGTFKVYVIGFNHQNVNGVYFQCFRDSTGTYDVVVDASTSTGSTDGTKTYNMMHWGAASYGGWKGCDLRYDILGSTDVPPDGYGSTAIIGRVGYDATSTCATNPVQNTLMAALPSDLRTAIAPWTVWSDNVGSSRAAADVTTSIDYLPLLSAYEIFGDTISVNCNPEEKNHQARFDYYTNGGSITKSRHTNVHSAIGYWTRSYASSASSFIALQWSGSVVSGGSNFATPITPAFRVA